MLINMHSHFSTPNLAGAWTSALGLRNLNPNAAPTAGNQPFIDNLMNGLMKERGVDFAILSPIPVYAFQQWEDPLISVPWPKVQNNTIAQAAKLHPEKFAAMGVLPLGDMKESVKELERSVQDLGLLGAMVTPNISGLADDTTTMDNEYWYPLYEKAQQLDVPLYVHPETPRYKRLRKYTIQWTMGFIIEESIAVATLIHGGILDQFPRLKVVIAHGGGWIPYQIGRYEGGPGTIGGVGGAGGQGGVAPAPPNEGTTKLKGSYTDAMRKIYFDCAVYSPEGLKCLIDVVGADHVMYGTEDPGGWSNIKRPNGLTASWMSPLIEKMVSAEDKKKIFEDNARKVFKLK